jgi:hypothetical protein
MPPPTFLPPKVHPTPTKACSLPSAAFLAVNTRIDLPNR